MTFNRRLITPLLGQWSTWAYFLILTLCTFKFLSGVSSLFPIDAFNESAYLYLGTSPEAPLRPTWGPIYAFFYRVYGFITSDPEGLYYINFLFQITLLTVAQFVLLRRLQIEPFVAFCSSLLLLLLPTIVTVSPRINHFNLSFLYCGLIGLSYVRSHLRAIYAMAMVSLLAIYLRQDNILISLGLLVYWLAVLLKTAESAKYKFRVATAGVAGFVALYLVSIYSLGSPFAPARTWSAFISHYFWTTTGTSLRPTNAAVINVFGPAESVGQALIANPTEFLTHMAHNVPGLLRGIVADSLNYFQLFKFQNILLAAIFGILLLWRLRRGIEFRDLKERIKALTDFHKLTLVFAALVCAKCAFLSLLLSPRPRYYLEIICILALGLAGIVQSLMPAHLKFSKFLMAAALGLLLFMPRVGEVVAKEQYLEDDLFRKSIHFLKNAERPKPPVYFSIRSYPYYIDGDVPTVIAQDLFSSIFSAKCKTVDEIQQALAEAKPNIVILDKFFRYVSRAKECPEWITYFEQNFAKLGFRQVWKLDDQTAVYFALPRKQ